MYPKGYEKELYSDYYDRCPYTSSPKPVFKTSSMKPPKPSKPALNLFVKREPPPYQVDLLIPYLVSIKRKFFTPIASYADILTSVAIRSGMDLDKIPNVQVIKKKCEEYEKKEI
jgi:hypothetical protein